MVSWGLHILYLILRFLNQTFRQITLPKYSYSAKHLPNIYVFLFLWDSFFSHSFSFSLFFFLLSFHPSFPNLIIPHHLLLFLSFFLSSNSFSFCLFYLFIFLNLGLDCSQKSVLFASVQFRPVAQSCLTLCNHMDRSTGKTIALTRWTFVGRVMSLLFNMLSSLVITFLPSSKHLLISWLQSPSTVILEPPKIKS